MNKENSPTRFKVGDIVQEGGHGRGMVVADSAKFKDRWWDDVPDAVVCEWIENGQSRELVYLSRDLELVGYHQRRSDAELYEKITALALQSITALAIAGDHQQALGAFKMWSDFAGPMTQDEDALRLQQLVD